MSVDSRKLLARPLQDEPSLDVQGFDRPRAFMDRVAEDLAPLLEIAELRLDRQQLRQHGQRLSVELPEAARRKARLATAERRHGHDRAASRPHSPPRGRCRW